MTSKTPRELSGPLSMNELTSVFVPIQPGKDMVGLELEKFAVDAAGRPLPVLGPRSLRTILEILARDHRWKPEREGDWIIALHRNGDMISVEPGGQLELSTAPDLTIDRAMAAEREHLDVLAEITGGWGLIWCAGGMHPIARLDDVAWIPKRRYLIMRDYLAGTGDLSHWMMKMTASLQVSIDYKDEADAALKLGVIARLSPILTAICAASPLSQGQPNGFQSFRSNIWAHTDPARCGLPKCYFKKNFSFKDYVEYALDIPMFFIERWRPRRICSVSATNCVPRPFLFLQPDQI